MHVWDICGCAGMMIPCAEKLFLPRIWHQAEAGFDSLRYQVLCTQGYEGEAATGLLQRRPPLNSGKFLKSYNKYIIRRANYLV